jgi:hypothetical protein
MDYWCKLPPEVETVYSEVSVHCWKMKVSTIKLGKKWHNNFAVSDGYNWSS